MHEMSLAEGVRAIIEEAAQAFKDNVRLMDKLVG